MQTGQPSRTAMGAAAHRAAHQLLEGGRILSDPLAVPILGVPVETLNDESRHEPFSRALRLFIALRSRLAEEAVAEHRTRGLRQVVILARGRLEAAAIAIPESLRFAPVDFERETLAEGLTDAGFDPYLPSFFTWLGVVPYLTETAVFGTLAYIAALPGGAQVIFDYANPRTECEAGRAGHAALAARVASIGEAFKSFFETEVVATHLRDLGFTDIEDWGPGEIAARFFPGRIADPSNRGGHILRASHDAPRPR